MRGQVYYHVAKALTTFYNAVGPTTYRAKLLGMFGTLDIVNAIQKKWHTSSGRSRHDKEPILCWMDGPTFPQPLEWPQEASHPLN